MEAITKAYANLYCILDMCKMSHLYLGIWLYPEDVKMLNNNPTCHNVRELIYCQIGGFK